MTSSFHALACPTVPAPAALAEVVRAQLAGREPSALLCFATSQVDLGAVTAALVAAFPSAVIAACTTCGELGPAGCTVGGVSVAALSAPCRASGVLVPDLAAFRFEQGGALLRTLTAGLGLHPNDLRPSRHVLLTLTDGLSGIEELLIASLTAHAPGVSLVGGSAGDDFHFVATHVALGASVASNAAVVLLLEPNAAFHTFHLHHYAPSGHEVVVTDAEPSRRLVRRLDGHPATRVLADLLHVAEAALLADPQRVLQAHSPVFGFRAAHALRLRSVMNVDGGALFLGGAVETGTILHVMRPGDLVEETRKGVAAARAQVTGASGMLLFNCGGRMWEATNQQRVPALAEAMQLSQAVGFTTYGEQFGPLQVNHTLTGLVLGGGHG